MMVKERERGYSHARTATATTSTNAKETRIADCPRSRGDRGSKAREKEGDISNLIKEREGYSSNLARAKFNLEQLQRERDAMGNEEEIVEGLDEWRKRYKTLQQRQRPTAVNYHATRHASCTSSVEGTTWSRKSMSAYGNMPRNCK